MNVVKYNAIVVYNDGIKEQYDAIRTTERGVVIGRIIKRKFIDCGFISKANIKEIKNSKKFKNNE